MPLTLICAGIVWYLTYRGISISTRRGVALGSDRDRDHGVRVGAARDQRRQPEHALRVHPRRRGNPARPPGDGLLPARLRRLRSGRAAGRGDPRPEAQHAPGDRLVGGPDRHLLRLLLLRGDRLLRPGQDGGLHRRPTRAIRGAAWPSEVLPGIGSLLVTIAIINSCLANANSGANASTRSVFALGRSRLHPGRLRDGPSDPSDAGRGHPLPGDHRDHHRRRPEPVPREPVSRRPGTAQHLLHDRLRDRLVLRGDVYGGQHRDHRLLLARAARRVQLVQAPDRARSSASSR